MKIHWLAALLLLSFFEMPETTAKDKPDRRIYSNVEYIEEAGDLIGMELELTISHGQVNGLLKIYQGQCASPINVNGNLQGRKLHLTGISADFGNQEINATIREASLVLNGGKTNGEKIILKRVSQPHCSF